MSTVASYMVLPANRERYHEADYNYFIHEKDEDVYRQRGSIRNSCLDLVSSLIEVFGDATIESILVIVEKLLQKAPSTQTAAANDQETDDTTTSVSTPSKSEQPSIDDINIFEYSYHSKNKKHQWKRREVALFILGNFAEDISMFRIRNPQF